jgi:mRNA interferase MazF
MKNKIVLVPFPFDDLTGTKLRPALCLTDLIGIYDHLVICFITSQIAKATEPNDLPILAIDHDFKSTGLKTDSAVRLHRLVELVCKVVPHPKSLPCEGGTSKTPFPLQGPRRRTARAGDRGCVRTT